MDTISKTIQLGKIDGYDNGRKSCAVDIEVRVRDQRGNPELSICGNIWNSTHTDIISGGQNLEEIGFLFLTNPKVQRIVEVWRQWHLNCMRAGCTHQRALENTPAVGTPCEVCEYPYGSAWLVEELPEAIIEEVKSW